MLCGDIEDYEIDKAWINLKQFGVLTSLMRVSHILRVRTGAAHALVLSHMLRLICETDPRLSHKHNSILCISNHYFYYQDPLLKKIYKRFCQHCDSICTQ